MNIGSKGGEPEAPANLAQVRLAASRMAAPRVET
jgi:hypothetical protein